MNVKIIALSCSVHVLMGSCALATSRSPQHNRYVDRGGQGTAKKDRYTGIPTHSLLPTLSRAMNCMCSGQEQVTQGTGQGSDPPPLLTALPQGCHNCPLIDLIPSNEPDLALFPSALGWRRLLLLTTALISSPFHPQLSSLSGLPLIQIQFALG